MAEPPLDAVLFDLDGVLTRTARVHLAAWTRTFDAFLRRRGPQEGEEQRPFTPEDYRAYVDGRPRFEGIRTFLKARGIELSEGTPEDAPEAETICALGRRKNALFRELLEERGVEVDPAAAPLLSALREAGVRVAVCTSSKNGAAILERAGLSALLDARVDGVTSEELGLAGKPAPDIFLTGAKRLRARPARSVVVEDATSGAEAGRRGGFGLVIGVDASGRERKALLDAGAHWIIRDLSAVSLEELRGRMGAAP